MAQHKITDELLENIKSLSTDEQGSLLFHIKHKLKGEPLKPTAKPPLTFSVEIPALGNITDTEFKQLTKIAKSAAYYSEAVFWLLAEFHNQSWDNPNLSKIEELHQNLSFICRLGISLASESANNIDKAELLFQRISKDELEVKKDED